MMHAPFFRRSNQQATATKSALSITVLRKTLLPPLIVVITTIILSTAQYS